MGAGCTQHMYEEKSFVVCSQRLQAALVPTVVMHAYCVDTMMRDNETSDIIPYCNQQNASCPRLETSKNHEMHIVIQTTQ